jgi:hypothetical protein
MPPKRITRSAHAESKPYSSNSKPSPSKAPLLNDVSRTPTISKTESPSELPKDANNHTLPLNPLTYPYTPNEKGVLTVEPYKSLLLPKWRFRTADIARESSAELWASFLEYDIADDFIGQDMARKFIQMGMTRAKRYANYAGGRKYAAAKDGEGADEGSGGGKGRQLEKSKGHQGKEEKEKASAVFREVWERCKVHENYLGRKQAWMEETRRLKALQKKMVKDEVDGGQ